MNIPTFATPQAEKRDGMVINQNNSDLLLHVEFSEGRPGQQRRGTSLERNTEKVGILVSQKDNYQ